MLVSFLFLTRESQLSEFNLKLFKSLIIF